MAKKAPSPTSSKPTKAKSVATKTNDSRGKGDELHQQAGGQHPALTTNQGLPLSDNQNSLRATPRGPTLLEDFILREKITNASRSASCTRAARQLTAISS